VFVSGFPSTTDVPLPDHRETEGRPPGPRNSNTRAPAITNTANPLMPAVNAGVRPTRIIDERKREGDVLAAFVRSSLPPSPCSSAYFTLGFEIVDSGASSGRTVAVDFVSRDPSSWLEATVFVCAGFSTEGVPPS